MKFEPFNYQTQAIKFILERTRCGLFLSMGLGKTVITLTAIKKLLDTKDISSVLIVAPLHVANTVWKQESRKWSHTLDLNIQICTGSVANRKRTLRINPDILVTNNENLRWLTVNRNQFDMIVIDESSLYKSHSTKRFSMMKSLNSKAVRTVILTGTPSPQNLIDLWSQIFFLDFGHRLGRTISAYRIRYFYDAGYKYPDWQPRIDSLGRVGHLISDITMTVRSNQLENNRTIHITEKVELPSESRKVYETLKKELVAEYKDNFIVTPHTAAMVNKLTQITGGSVYDENNDIVELDNTKLKRLENIISEYPDENILVVSNYRHHTDSIFCHFEQARKLSTEYDINAWNRGEIRLLICHPKSAGFGLNMQEGGSILVWFGLSWSLTDYLQMNARLDRTGQKGIVRIVHLLASDTIDEHIYNLLKSRKSNQNELMNLLIREKE